MNPPSHPYLLGHSEREIQRLQVQARMIDPITRRFFVEAGIAPGMRVLDVGSGAGDTAFVAADLVGETGAVVGVDRVDAAVDTATARARSMSLDHVSFRAGDPAEIEFDRPFDAVLGRYVLQFQNDPASFLRRLAAHVRSGGIVVFHELDWGGCASVPSSPVFDRLCRWGVETLRRHGTEPRMGVKLHATFIAAGLGPPQMRLEAPVTGGPEPTALRLLTDFVPTILPEMERLGVATSVEVGPNDLFERMASDGMANGSVFVLFHQWGAWASVGDGSRAPEA